MRGWAPGGSCYVLVHACEGCTWRLRMFVSVSILYTYICIYIERERDRYKGTEAIRDDDLLRCRLTPRRVPGGSVPAVAGLG